MTKKGFASMYIVYTFLTIFILMMLSVLMINNYKQTFLNTLKNDIKNELAKDHLNVNAAKKDNLLLNSD